MIVRVPDTIIKHIFIISMAGTRTSDYTCIPGSKISCTRNQIESRTIILRLSASHDHSVTVFFNQCLIIRSDFTVSGSTDPNRLCFRCIVFQRISYENSLTNNLGVNLNIYIIIIWPFFSKVGKTQSNRTRIGINSIRIILVCPCRFANMNISTIAIAMRTRIIRRKCCRDDG